MRFPVFQMIFIFVAVLAGASLAQDGPQYPDFTFRRVAVPTSGTTGRINVQIDPETQFDALPPIATPRSETEPDPEPPEGPPQVTVAPDEPYQWFWDLVSPSLDAASSGRLEQAVHSLGQNEQAPVSAPRLQDLQNIAQEFGTEILVASVGTNISPAFALAVIGVESSGRATVESPAGATGLMQLIPATAERFGVKDAKDPADNIRGGIAYLDWLMGQFESDPVLVLAAYNAGENAVRKNNGVPQYPETRAYVPKVLAAWTVARGLCLTPPELVSDGCVFSIREARNDG